MKLPDYLAVAAVAAAAGAGISLVAGSPGGMLIGGLIAIALLAAARIVEGLEP
jgi:hypothetical protein